MTTIEGLHGCYHALEAHLASGLVSTALVLSTGTLLGVFLYTCSWPL